MPNQMSFPEVLREEFAALHGEQPPIARGAGVDDSVDELAAIYRAMDDLPQPTAALCLSGGGIRSATFALGILQGLARMNLLGRFDYLSTVSGGGYIGSWLTSWICRHPDGLDGVVRALREEPSIGKPDSPEVGHLRRFSNYLTPQLGLFSLDSWSVISTVLRNLVLNWMVLLPFLAALVVLPSLYLSLLPLGAPHAPPPAIMWSLFVTGWLLVIMAVLFLGRFQPGNHVRARSGTILRLTFVPLAAGALLITACRETVLREPGNWVQWEGWIAAGIGAVGHLAAWLVYTRGKGRGPIIAIEGMYKDRSLKPPTTLRNATDYFVLMVTVIVTGALAGYTAVSLLARLQADPRWYAALGPPAALSAFLAGGTLFVGLMSRESTDDDREYWARFGSWVLIGILIWSAAGVLVLFGPRWLEGLRLQFLSLGTVSGAITWLLGRSSETPAIGRLPDEETWKSYLLRKAPEVSGSIFLIFLFVFLAWALEAARAALGEAFPRPWALDLALLAALCVIVLVFSLFINVNRFSLHAMYRNRLTRAYLGATRERHPHPFTGFDPKDDMPMHCLAPDAATGRKRPLHIINCALNLVGGKELAWQERKADNFTISPLHCGNARVGYRPTRQYGGDEGISLGTALAISGAAVSPNMGYHSSPLVSFLLTLFNARLGAWLGNPGAAGERTYRRDAPGCSLIPLVKELFGLTDENSDYVYLSDGGHFDNTGIYEMVRRRCRIILVSDAGCDPKFAFEDLGNAVRKVRIDLGVSIELEKMRLYPRAGGGTSAYCAMGNIRYDRMGGKPGLLFYLKPALGAQEPIDVRNYATTSPPFPHESTSDQWFSETQFESYRMLGRHIISSICDGDLEDLDFENLKDRVRRYLAGIEAPQGTAAGPGVS